MHHSEKHKKTRTHKKLPIQKRYKNIVLCGGGSKCIAFCGALCFLEKHDLIKNIERIIGVSAGALIGLLLVLGYKSGDIDSEIEQLNNHKIFGSDSGAMSLSLSSIPQLIYSLCFNYGANNGNTFFNYLRDVFIAKGIPYNITFADLYQITKIDFTVGATSLTHKTLKTFNKTNTPFTSVIKAIMASTSVPFIFKPVKIDDDFYVDGGLKNNFPISLVPKKEHTIALRLETYDDDVDEFTTTTYNFLSYITDIIDVIFSNTWADENSIKQDHKIDIYRILVPNINFMNFDLNPHIKQKLRNAGYDTLERNILSF